MKKITGSIVITIALSIFCGCSGNEMEPVLVLATDTGFGTYTGEILKTEGFNLFRIEPASGRLPLKYLQRFDLIILADSVNPATGEKLIQYVESGGNLIAFRPDPQFDILFGIKTREAGPLKDGYIEIDTTTEQGKGLTKTSLQYHGDADRYAAGSGRMIARLFEGPKKETDYAAVIGNRHGKGQAVAFAFNLPESIVYTRQGDPSKAGKETDGITGIRAMDLFTGGWVDTTRNTVNQADEQMRLLSHCIESMTKSTKPLPRLWYFPDSLNSLVTLTNDGEYREEADFEIQLAEVDTMGAKMSLYILETNKVSRAWVQRWVEKGFEISGHPDDTEEAADPGWDNMYDKLLYKREEIQTAYGLPMKTVVNHWFVWCGKDQDGKPEFAAQAEIGSAAGFEMDVNYAHYDNNSSEGHFLGPAGHYQGNYTGSGLVMKFARSDGKILNIYQHLNNVYDQQYMENNDPSGYFNCFKGLVDRSLHEGVYSFISIKAHNDEYFFSREPLMKMLDYARQKNIPVWTAAKLADFIKMKDETRFSDIRWSGNMLKFRVNTSLPFDWGLTLLLPAEYNHLKIQSILINGDEGDYTIRQIKGYYYVLVTVVPGSVYEISAQYS